MPWLLMIVSYVLGAIPTSYVVGRAGYGLDLRQHGSGNLGATNVFRVLGWKAAVPVFVIDILKGWFPTFAFVLWDGAAAWEWALAYGTAAIIGHVFSVFVGFRGGKGIATSAGVFLALAPAAVIVGLVVWAALVFSTRIVSVGSVAAAVTLPVIVYFTRGVGPVLWVALGLAAFVIFAHRANIGRLLRGEEHRFGQPRIEEAP